MGTIISPAPLCAASAAPHGALAHLRGACHHHSITSGNSACRYHSDPAAPHGAPHGALAPVRCACRYHTITDAGQMFCFGRLATQRPGGRLSLSHFTRNWSLFLKRPGVMPCVSSRGRSSSGHAPSG